MKALQPVERRTFVAAMLLLPLAGLGLRLFGLARMQTLLRVKRPLAQASASLLEIQSMGKLVNMAAKQSPFPATCLTRSTLLAWMLARRGIPCQLRIGVKLDEGAFAAHAWVEWQGIPVNDKPDIATRFHAFESPEPPSAFQTS
ncbi:lasso peptide biosynthesis B2 protein [Ramlibacter sp. WS9]|nr:lasso peptide biosynthesis B2 protein [Ramlibacter sp. WS9]